MKKYELVGNELVIYDRSAVPPVFIDNVIAAGGTVRYVEVPVVKTISAENARLGLAKIDLLNEIESWAKLNENAYVQYLVADEWHYGNPFIESAIDAKVITRKQVDAIFDAA